MRKVVVGICLMLFLGVSGAFGAEEAGEKAMDRIAAMEKHRTHLVGKPAQTGLAVTDPEFVAIRDRLIYGEIADRGTLSEKQRELVTLAALAAVQTPAALRLHVGSALKANATAVEIREVIYQITPYIGFPRATEALESLNVAFESHGIKLPLPSQGTVSEESRFKDGLAVQKQIFGADNIGKMQANAPAGQQDIITNYLSAFCFGDFYTRKGLDLKMRELVTFSAIVALGGCDPQVKAHAAANISVGNSKQNLVDCLTTLLPYIGFPRTLNGLAQVNAAVPEQ